MKFARTPSLVAPMFGSRSLMGASVALLVVSVAAGCGGSTDDAEPPGSGGSGTAGAAGTAGSATGGSAAAGKGGSATAGQGGGGTAGKGAGGSAPGAGGSAGTTAAGGAGGASAGGSGGTGGAGGASAGGAAGSGGTGTGGTGTGGTGTGGTGAGGTGGTGGSGGAAGAAPASRQPPVAGPPHPGDGMDATFAFSKLLIGDTDPDGTPDTQNGWKNYGYDLDHDVSTQDSKNLCQPVDNAAVKNVYPDGIDGTDNSYGHNILPITLGISSDASTKINDQLTTGKWTFLVTVRQLGSSTGYNPLTACVYLATDLGAPPKFDGTDLWPVDDAGLTDASDVTKCKALFTMSYLVDDTWVSGPVGADVTVPTSGVFYGNIHEPVLTMKLSADHLHVESGVLAGVLWTSEVVAGLKQVAGSFDPALCSGPTIDSITAQVSQASDILADGTQDPTKSCDGISIGIGFHAERALVGKPVHVTPPPPACP